MLTGQVETDRARAAFSYLQLAIMQRTSPTPEQAKEVATYFADQPPIAVVRDPVYPSEMLWAPADDADINLRIARDLINKELGEDDGYPDQTEIVRWVADNFNRGESHADKVIGLVEEVGELCRAVLKRKQGVRGSYEQWTDEIEKELGDIFIKGCDVVDALGFTWSIIARKRWQNVISKRRKGEHNQAES